MLHAALMSHLHGPTGARRKTRDAGSGASELDHASDSGARVEPELLANVAARSFDDHLPYNRLENVYEREGMRLGRSTLHGWLDALPELFAPLIQ
jgi:hypothetical protein